MIIIKRESDLEIQTWVFRYSELDHTLSLSSWRRDSRASTRHKFRCSGEWQWRTPLNRPVAPADVIDEARRQFVETLKVEE